MVLWSASHLSLRQHVRHEAVPNSSTGSASVTSDNRLSPLGGDAPETSPFRRLGYSKQQARPPRGDGPDPGARGGIETPIGLLPRPGKRRLRLYSARPAGRVENVDVEASGVQIDSAVEWVLCFVDARGKTSLATGRPDPASWLPCFGIG